MDKLKSFCQTFGLHPLTALGLFVVDWLLFGEEIATVGFGWFVTIPVGIVLALVVFLIQKHAYKDETGAALGKALLTGLLTAIPAPLSSLGILPLAAFGAIKTMTTKPRALPEVQR